MGDSARGELTDSTGPYVRAHLQRARRWRTVGFTLGWSAPYVHLWVTRSAYEQWGYGFPAIVGGYLVGALGAELSSARLRPSTQEAEITTRSLDLSSLMRPDVGSGRSLRQLSP